MLKILFKVVLCRVDDELIMADDSNLVFVIETEVSNHLDTIEDEIIDKRYLNCCNISVQRTIIIQIK